MDDEDFLTCNNCGLKKHGDEMTTYGRFSNTVTLCNNPCQMDLDEHIHALPQFITDAALIEVIPIFAKWFVRYNNGKR